MLTWLLRGAPLAGLLVVGFTRSPEHRATSAIIAMLPAPLACFAVGADRVHVAAQGRVRRMPMTRREIIEAGGEIVVGQPDLRLRVPACRHPAAFLLEAQTKGPVAGSILPWPAGSRAGMPIGCP